MVIIHHVEQFRFVLDLENNWGLPFVQVVGKLGVILFFVLSGFLITYLLLVEKKDIGNISVRSFYIRRILRIWPLYYLMVFISFFILSNIGFLSYNSWSGEVFNDLFPKLALFILFLPNLALILYTPVPFVSQSWSVGVEEQFYLIWPLLIKFFKKTELLLYGVIFMYLFIKLVVIRLIAHSIGWNPTLETFSAFISTFNIDCMAIGGLLALYLFQKRRVLKILFHKYTQVLTIIILIVFISLGIKIPFIHFEFYAILFGILIINLAANKTALINLENNLLRYLGKISYGLYMYHPLAIVISLKLLDSVGLNITIFQYILSLCVSIFFSGLSYHYYEKYFIKKKVLYSKVLSGDNTFVEIKKLRYSFLSRFIEKW